jgi:hypothetical protein
LASSAPDTSEHSAQGLNKKDLFLPAVFEQRPHSSFFTPTRVRVRARPNLSPTSHSSLSHKAPLARTRVRAFFIPLLLPSEARSRFRNKSDQFERNRSAFEERTRYRISYYSTGILLPSTFPIR